MVTWKSPAEIEKDVNAFSKFEHALIGLYLWEFFISVPFDIDVFIGRKKFRWPLIFYFAGRYSLLFALIGIAIALNVTTEINCQALYIFDQVFGNASIGFASINLSLRTIAVWSQAWYIWVPILLLILGHWSLLLHGLLITAAWVPPTGCEITRTDNTILAATFIYSMCFDFIVLCLTAYKLFFPGKSQSKLVKLIFGDGLIYFIVAFLANLIATVFMILNLNAVMSIVFNVPAAIASTIVASRAVRRLSEFSNRGPDVYRTSKAGTSIAFGKHTVANSLIMTKKSEIGIMKQMETITTLAEAESGQRSFLEYDASGNLKDANYVPDPESQVISGEFRRPPY